MPGRDQRGRRAARCGRQWPRRYGKQAPEAVGAVAGQFHQVGDLAKRGFDPVVPLGDDLLQGRRHAAPLALGGGTSTPVPRVAWETANALPLKPLSTSRSGWRRPASGRLVATSRSLTAAGTMPQARTRPLA